MKLSKDLKYFINELSIEDILRHMRNDPPGTPVMMGVSGEYILKRMATLRTQDPHAFFTASKRIGWA